MLVCSSCINLQSRVFLPDPTYFLTCCMCSSIVVEVEEVGESIGAIKLVKNFRASKCDCINCTMGKLKDHKLSFIFLPVLL